MIQKLRVLLVMTATWRHLSRYVTVEPRVADLGHLHFLQVAGGEPAEHLNLASLRYWSQIVAVHANHRLVSTMALRC